MIDRWLSIPYPPSVNHYWGMRGKIKFLTAKAKAFRYGVAVAFKDFGDTELGPLHLMIEQRPPDRRRRDIDNIVKPIMDAMEHARVYENDCQVSRLSVIRGPIAKGGECFIKLERIDPCWVCESELMTDLAREIADEYCIEHLTDPTPLTVELIERELLECGVEFLSHKGKYRDGIICWSITQHADLLSGENGTMPCRINGTALLLHTLGDLRQIVQMLRKETK